MVVHVELEHRYSTAKRAGIYSIELISWKMQIIVFKAEHELVDGIVSS